MVSKEGPFAVALFSVWWLQCVISSYIVISTLEPLVFLGGRAVEDWFSVMEIVFAGKACFSVCRGVPWGCIFASSGAFVVACGDSDLNEGFMVSRVSH